MLNAGPQERKRGTMSFIHNRMGITLCVAAIAAVLLGAGCQKQGYQPNSGALDQGTSPTSPSSDAMSTLPTKWAEYRSDKLGITIPYPEGWYVEEGSDQQALDMYRSRPPEDSDMPALIWFERQPGSIEGYLQQLDEVVQDESVQRAGKMMRRISRRSDLFDDLGLSVQYVWIEGDEVYRVGGFQDDPILEYIVDRIEVLR